MHKKEHNTYPSSGHQFAHKCFFGAFVIAQTKLSRIFNGSFATSELSLDHCTQLSSAIKGERGGDLHPLEFLKHQ